MTAAVSQGFMGNLWPFCVAAFVIALAAVRGLIGYALQRGMLDQPGQRRSHTVPTPRGGGLGVVLAVLAAGTAWSLSASPGRAATGVLTVGGVALLAVAAIGWWDDRVGLAALPRLLVHVAAATVFALALHVCLPDVGLGWVPVLGIAGAASVNLHNFMDGIDGLLGMQSVFVSAVLAGMGYALGITELTALAAITACSALGFLRYNLPPARIFMGDVGSGSLGLLVFMFVALVWSACSEYAWSALIACSGFLIDAGLTLAWRVLRGRRWYSAHREHLYQWLVRRGLSHAWTGCLYMTWNLISLPAVLLAWHRPGQGPLIALAWYALGALAWFGGRRWCLSHVGGKR